MLHLGHAADGRLDEHVVDRAVTLVESTSPSSLLLGSLDAARRSPPTDGRELLDGDDSRARGARARRSARCPGLDVLDERIVGRPGVHGYDPLRLAVDVRGTGASGYQVARLHARAGRRQPRAGRARP